MYLNLDWDNQNAVIHYFNNATFIQNPCFADPFEEKAKNIYLKRINPRKNIFLDIKDYYDEIIQEKYNLITNK